MKLQRRQFLQRMLALTVALGAGPGSGAWAAAPGALPDVVGEDLEYQAAEGDSLLSIAQAHGLAVEHLAFANGFDVSAAQIVPGSALILPKRRILPANPPRDGLVLNLPERGLYRFSGGSFVEFLPVAVGAPPATLTPLGEHRVVEKVVDPTWYPPAWAADSRPVPPGPDNPLGDRWLGLSAPRIGIHGTNNPINVGGSVTHGCVRCYPADIRRLFSNTALGTPVRIEYETAKWGRSADGTPFLANFPDLYGRSDPVVRAGKLLKDTAAEPLLADSNFGTKLQLTLGIALNLDAELARIGAQKA